MLTFLAKNCTVKALDYSVSVGLHVIIFKPFYAEVGRCENIGAIMNGGPISLSTKIEKVKSVTIRPAITD